MIFKAKLGDRGTVYLDGQPITDVIECDTDAGTAVVLLRDAKGNVVFDRERGEVETEVKRGIVSFVRRIPTA